MVDAALWIRNPSFCLGEKTAEDGCGQVSEFRLEIDVGAGKLNSPDRRAQILAHFSFLGQQ
jgi:hypothetical protein